MSQPAPAQQGRVSHVPNRRGDPAGSWALNHAPSPGCSQQGPGEGRPSLQPTGPSLCLLRPELPRKGGEEAVHPQRGVCYPPAHWAPVPLGSVDRGKHPLALCDSHRSIRKAPPRPPGRQVPGHLPSRLTVSQTGSGPQATVWVGL